MYEKGARATLTCCFPRRGFSDLLLRMDMIQQIYDHDQTLIQGMETTKATIEAAKQAIEETKKDE